MIFLQELIYTTLTSACKWPLSFGFPFQSMWIHVCSVQHVLYAQSILSTRSQCSSHHEATCYSALFCKIHSHTQTHVPLQENANCRSKYL